MAKTFKEGEKIKAKWPGSRRFEDATVVSVTKGKEGLMYKVRYADQTFASLSYADLQAKSPRKQSSSPKKAERSRSVSKSPARTTKERSVSRGRKGSRTPSQSPSRTKATTKSPKRVRSRSRSPSKSKPKQATARSRSRSPSKPKPKPKPKPKAAAAKTPPRTPPRTPSPAKKSKTTTKKDKGEELFSSPDTSPSPVKKKVVAKTPKSPASPSRKKQQTKEQLSESLSRKMELVPLLSKMSKIQSLEKEVEEVRLLEKGEEVDSVVSRKVYSTRSKMAAEKLQGGDNTVPVPKSKAGGMKVKAGLFGILFSVLSTALFPTLTIYLALNCVRKNYSLLSLPQVPKASAFFNAKVACVYLGFVLLQWLLAALPVGRVVRGFHAPHDRPRLQYRLNGIHCLILTVSLLGLLGYLGQPVYYVIDNFFKLTCTATAFSFLFSVALYVRSLLRPTALISQFADTGCTPYDFHHGRELHPRMGALYDLKLLTLRIALIGWAVVVISLTYKCYLLNGCVHYELALASGAQLLYILDLLYREEVMLATATVMHEGLGFGLTHAAYAMAPFTFTIPVYVLVNHKPNMPLYCLGGMAVLFLFALIMNRKSLMSKMMVKRNPDSPSVTDAGKIVAVPHEKVLLASGWWKLIRHPNYTSEVLMFLAWTLPCGVHLVLPYLPVALIFLSLLRRCFQVEAIMARSYQDAYQQYKHRVPYRLCPYLF